MHFAKKNRILFIGLALGALAGYLYWLEAGCASGTCAITANPYSSTAYGALMGGLLGSTFQKSKEKEKENANPSV